MTTLEQEHKQLQSKHTEACSRLAGLHKELEEEGERRVRAEAEAASLHVVNKGLRQDVERVSIVTCLVYDGVICIYAAHSISHLLPSLQRHFSWTLELQRYSLESLRRRRCCQRLANWQIMR